LALSSCNYLPGGFWANAITVVGEGAPPVAQAARPVCRLTKFHQFTIDIATSRLGKEQIEAWLREHVVPLAEG